MKKTKADFKKAGTSNGKKIVIKIVTISFSVLALVITFVYLSNIDRAARDTVDIARIIKAVPAYAAILKEDLESYSITKREFDKDSMILFDDVEDYINEKYAAYYLRESTPLYVDQLIDKRPPRNGWLYELSEGYEVITIPYNYMEAGGDILLPGDTIRVRAAYEVDAAPIAPEDEYENPNQYTYQTATKIKRIDTVFKSVVVTDMLNSSGHSVYEVYIEVMRLDEKQRQEVMKSNDFISSIKPKSLILACSPEDIDRYFSYKTSVNSGSFLITLLSRTDNRIDIDFFAPLETEVRSWIDKRSSGI